MARKTYRVITWGGLGDVLLSTPTFAQLKENDPHCKIVLFCQTKAHMEVFYNNPHVDELRSISFLGNPVSFARHYFKLAHFHTLNYGFTHPSLFGGKPAAEIIAELFGVKLRDKRVQVFLSEKEEAAARQQLAPYRIPVVIHISSRASKNQEWPLENWEALVREMPGCTFIQLGVPTEASVAGAVDLRGKTTFRQALALLKHAAGFAGVVSAFSHATNAFGTPGVVLFGASTPTVWGHANNINIYKNWRCAPCIDLLFGSKCPYAKACITAISVEEVRQALSRQLAVPAAPGEVVQRYPFLSPSTP
jgi:ADP-heptose:LPS heptosyltransferase